MATDQPRITWFTPFVKAAFPQFDVPKCVIDSDTKKETGDPIYSCRGILREEDVEQVTEHLESVLKKLKPGIKHLRIPMGTDKKDENVHFINVKSSHKFKPLVVDAKNHKVSDEVIAKIGGGSILRFFVTLSYYKKGANEGLTAYVNQVQLVKLVEKNDRGAPQFDEVDGFEAGEDEKAPAFGTVNSADMHDF